MSVNVRYQCAVCGWREKCDKKHTIKQSGQGCPDFVRDVSLPPEEAELPAEKGEAEEETVKHKKIEDPFA